MNDRYRSDILIAAHDLHDHAHPRSECETCRIEQQEFDETLAELTALAAAAPPERLRSDLLSAIRQVRPLPPLVLTSTAASPAAPSTVSSAEPQVPAAPTDLATRRRGRATTVLTMLVAAALVVALSLGVWVHSLGEQHRSDVAASSTQDRLLSAPDVKIFRSSLNGAPVSYVVSRRLDQAMLIGTDVPDPGTARTYQLWRITAAGPQPAGLMGGGSVHHWFSGTLEGSEQLAITVERSGGAKQPSQAPRSAVAL